LDGVRGKCLSGLCPVLVVRLRDQTPIDINFFLRFSVNG
jgi:hypothetical protein